MYVLSRRAMKFGGLGTVIGHELQHAFDDESVFFNGDGDLDADMLDVADKAAFLERTECIEAIYSNFSLSPGIPVRFVVFGIQFSYKYSS